MAPVPAVPAALPLTRPQLRIRAGIRHTSAPGPRSRRSRPQIKYPQSALEIIAFAFQMNWKMSNNGICPEPGT